MRSTIRTTLAAGAVTAGLLFGAVAPPRLPTRPKTSSIGRDRRCARRRRRRARHDVAGNEGWRNAVQVTGLTPNTSDTWVGIGMGTHDDEHLHVHDRRHGRRRGRRDRGSASLPGSELGLGRAPGCCWVQ